MRALIVTEFLSLDGVMENPGWSLPYWNDDIAGFKLEEDRLTDALLLGRVTYQGFAAAWPNSPDEGAARMNSMPKYVVSTTLETVDWHNSRLVTGDVVAEITRLKQQDGQGILVYGSATLLKTLIQHDLVDSYRLLVYPVVLGKGRRLFDDDTALTLKLVESRALSGGVLALVYEPART